MAGFKNVQTCTLVNSSLIPISFKLRIPGDGKNPSINAEDDLDLDDPSLAGSPCHGLSQAKEFEIIPSSGTIEAQSSLKVQVALTSNRAWTYENALVVDVDGIGSELFSVSISARYAKKYMYANHSVPALFDSWCAVSCENLQLRAIHIR